MHCIHTPFYISYAINANIDDLIKSLENDSSILIKWFSNNYLVMNAGKSHLLVTKHDDNVYIEVDHEIIEIAKQ